MNQYKNRREFIRSASTGVMGLGLASGALTGMPPVYSAVGKVKVAVVRNEKAVSNRNICDKKQVSLMLEKALYTVTLPPNQMSRCHGNTEFITQVCASPSIKNKTVLGVCDGQRGNYKRGAPWYWKGIIVSRDQVAAEYTALQVINEKLIKEKERPNSVPSYVKLAETAYKLGTCNPGNIETVKTVI